MDHMTIMPVLRRISSQSFVRRLQNILEAKQDIENDAPKLKAIGLSSSKTRILETNAEWEM